MRRNSRRLLRLVLAGLLCAGPAGAEDLLLLSEAPRIRDVTIDGNETVDTGTIEDLLSFRTASFLHPFRRPRLYRGQLDQDLQSIESWYRARGYINVDAVADVEEVDDGVVLHVHITEGEPYFVASVRVKGLDADQIEAVTRRLGSQPGRPYSPYRLEADRLAIEGWLADRGRPYARAMPSVDLAGNQARLEFAVTPGPFVRVGTIRLQADERVNKRGLSRELTIHPGDLMRRRELTKSRQRLYDTGLFTDVQFLPEPVDSVPELVNLVFQLHHRKTHWFGAGVGYSSENLVRLSGEWGSRSIFSTGRRLTLSAHTARDFLGRRPFFGNREHGEEATLYEPWLFGTRIRGQLSGFYRYDNVRNENIRQTTYGSTAQFTKEIRKREQEVSLAFEARWVKNQVEPSVRDSACAKDPILCRDRYRTRLASLRYLQDRRDDFLNPTKGSRHDVLFQVAGGPFGGDNNFEKVLINSSFHSRLGRRSSLATRVRIGTINPPGEVTDVQVTNSVDAVPFEDRFFTGGASSVRGYQDNTLNGLANGKDPTGGGLVELVMNAELKFPVLGPLGGVLFVDSGNVWRDFDRVHPRHFVPTFDANETEVETLRTSVGGGIRFNTPVGPVRLEGAYRLCPAPGDRPRDLHLALGNTF